MPEKPAPRLRRLFALIPSLIGLCALLGWAIGVPVLKPVFPGFVPMMANAALGGLSWRLRCPVREAVEGHARVLFTEVEARDRA